MGEAARQDDDVRALEVGVLVPDVLGVLAEDGVGGVVRVRVAVAAGEDDHGECHCLLLGRERRLSASAVTRPRA